MDIDAPQAQLMAQVIPVFLIAVVVERREIVNRVKEFHRTYKLVILLYLAAMVLAMQTALTHADSGASGAAGGLLFWTFWLSLGGGLFMLLAVFWDTKPRN